ncbi:phosphoribosylanthranilate isomerase [Facklamia sp. DSM 111018]|uniref:Phosphoribosylanthranilate isomerase n=1 Tax=Facklamia lactis TaxID=2749967 RepID=A0ABS0LS63_9LACT|nr:phosphoribosylanthranilate isomerase [Facklamia lactis]MBG9980373.1 phosphoribosylanthranilate isomerase [Facklamia lactis]MBG9986176.1 phosphoribosylanthranilate isomerase [Facklamia lactis]
MDKYYREFLIICAELNKIGIIPTLMGSVGLEYITRRSWQPTDLDIHVKGDPRGWEAPDDQRIYDWEKIYSMMQKLGYELIDRHEHEFKKEDLHVEFGSISSLYDFAGVEEDELTHIKEEVEFLVPSKEQYLNIYKASAQDSYRNDQNNGKDFLKIKYLEELDSEGREINYDKD